MIRNACYLACLVTFVIARARTTVTAATRTSLGTGTNDIADSGLVPQSAKLSEQLFGHGDYQDEPIAKGRTFGMKRIQFMLMPMIYKMGVMMTMLMVLTAISLKGLMIGTVLLVLKLSSILAKFYTAWQPQGYVHGHEWSSPHQPVHIHVHGAQYQQQAYGGWPESHNDEHYYYKG